MGKKIKVILLVAGEGKRLHPYTKNIPKCMVKINGVSLIDRQLDILNSEGIKNILMVGGYKADMLKKKNIPLILNKRYHETNMVWSLFCAEHKMDGDIIVSYGDIVYSQTILRTLLKSKADISVVIDKKWEGYWRSRNENPLDDAESLKLRNDGTILEIGKKPKSIDEIEGQYIGLIKFSAKGINHIKKTFHKLNENKFENLSMENAYMTDLLQAMIASGIKITAIPVLESWIEIDTVSDIESNVTLQRVLQINKY